MKTSRLFAFALALLCGIAFGSCDKQEDDIQIPEKVHGGLNVLEKDFSKMADGEGRLFCEYQVADAHECVKFKASVEKNRLHSRLSYKRGEQEWVDVSVFDIDLQEANHPGGMNVVIEKHANALKKGFDAPTVGRIGDILEEFPEILYYKLGKGEYNNELSLSVFYHLAAFSAARRAYESRSGDCQCGVNNSYLSGESPFFCAEDIMISADRTYDFIKEKIVIKKSEGYELNPASLFKYLDNESGRFVAASKVNKLLKDELHSYLNKASKKERQRILGESGHALSNAVVSRSNPESGDRWPVDPSCWLYGARVGSDCGCCGNYSGPCYKCFVECYAHDKACETCEPSWFCLSGCVPGPC